MTGAQFESLSANGYLILPEAVAAFTVAALLDTLPPLLDIPAKRNLLDHAAVANFAASEEARRIITPALGNGALPVRAILFDKLPGANWKVAWHQDLSIAVKERHDVSGFGPWSVKDGVAHVQPPARVLENMVTLRLHLDDCFADNGPVRVLPGSHVQGVLTPQRIEELRGQIAEVAAVSAAGGVLLMRPLLLHASSPASAPRHRRVVHIEYAGGELPAPLAWHAA